jgi:uncharacterized protein (TIGR00369 family)
MEIEPGLENCVDELMEGYENSLPGLLGIIFLSLKKGEVTACMPVDDRTRQPFGLLHGGASVALAETLASVGGWLCIDEAAYSVVGAEINANHIRAMKDGQVYGKANALHLGKSTQVWEIRITNSKDMLVCVSRCTLSVIPHK